MGKRKSELPLVSILIPNYNYQNTIGEAIDSAINQSYSNTEIIVLDNHSTDKSYEIAKKYRKYGVKVRQNKINMGCASHNKLLRMARGKYIHVLHSDDAVEPTFIEECVRLMENNPNVGFTVTERVEVDGNSKPLEQPSSPAFYNQSCIIPSDRQRAVLLMASYYIPSETVFRRDLLRKVGMYDINITNFMDWWLLYKCSCVSDMGCISKKLCRYRVWGGSETSYMTSHMIMPLTGFLIRKEMLMYAKLEKDELVLERKDRAIQKQADLTCKLGVDVIRQGMNGLGRQYLALAKAYSPAIEDKPLYQAIDSYLHLPKEEQAGIDAYLEKKNLCGKRACSYDPPEDFIPYTL